MSESETTPFSPTAAAPMLEARPLPRLGISHLLLWMLCTSLYSAVTRQSLEGLSAQWETQDEVTVAMRAGLILAYVRLVFWDCQIGAAWAGAAVLLFTRIRGAAPLLRQPGHWILLVVGMQAGIFMLLNFLPLQILDNDFILSIRFFRTSLLMAMAALYATAAWRSRSRRWTVFFAALVMQQIFDSLIPFAFSAVAWFQGNPGITVSFVRWTQVGAGILVAIAAVTLVAAIILDIRDRQNRDWLHWLGVAIFGISTLGTVVGLALALIVF